MGDEDTGFRIEALQDPACYPHPVESVERLETHGNWILLAGDYAYKIKKPVNLGFMDFSTLEKRHFYCQEEIRLNRRLAPALYHRVVGITGAPDAPRMDREGEPFEYAVLMSRFDDQQRLDHRLERGELAATSLDRLARDVAEFHATAPAAAVGGTADNGYGDPGALHEMVADNFRECRRLLPEADHPSLSTVEARSEARFQALAEQLDVRRREGRVRECHGDLHLGNLVFHDERIQAFDCIEFNPDFRWIDTANEVAFLSMDLKYRGRPDLASRWLNACLEASGDHEAAPLLGFFEAYRAMIRAKVKVIRASQHPGSDAAAADQAAARAYVQLAHTCLEPGGGRILITMGLSASGKSRIARDLVQTLPALRLRSDVERKRLFGLAPLADSHAGVDSGIYTAEASRRTYERLADLAAIVVRAGYNVIIDATFLRRRDREQFRQLAADNKVGFAILQTLAPMEVLESRIRQRRAKGGDPSEADLNVLYTQRECMDVITKAEAPYTIDISTTGETDIQQLAVRIQTEHSGSGLES